MRILHPVGYDVAADLGVADARLTLRLHHFIFNAGWNGCRVLAVHGILLWIECVPEIVVRVGLEDGQLVFMRERLIVAPEAVRVIAEARLPGRLAHHDQRRLLE